MSGNTYPARQRAIVGRGRFDRFRIESEKTKRESIGGKNKLKILFSAPSGPYDHKVYEGDLLFSVIQYSKFGGSSSLAPGNRQTPVVSSSLNGLCMESTKFKQYTDSKLDKDMAESQAVYDSIRFMGISFTNVEYDGEGMDGKGIVLQYGGANRVLNNGPDAWECGDYATWFVPRDGPQFREDFGQGFSETRRRLQVRKVDNVCDFTFENYVDYLVDNKAFEGFVPGNNDRLVENLKTIVNTDVVRSLEFNYTRYIVEAYEAARTLAIPEFTGSILAPIVMAYGLFQTNDFKKKRKAFAAANIWLTAQREERDVVSARTVFKVTRASTPGQNSDIILIK